MDKNLLGVVDKIYEASLAPAGINRLAAVLADALGTRSGFISFLARPDSRQRLPDIVGLPSATENFDEWARTAYAEHYHACNVWFEKGAKRGFPAIVLGHELIPPDALMRSEWYEYCQRLDAFHVLGAQFHLDANASVMFGAHRPRGLRAFNDADRQRMSLLLPHLQRALQVHVRLNLSERARVASLDILDRAGIGVLILDQERRVLFANARAERVLHDPRVFRIANGRVRPSERARHFDALATAAAKTSTGRGMGAGGMMHIALDVHQTLRLLVTPLPPHGAFGVETPAVMVLLSDPNGAAPPPVDVVRKAFLLTPAEARLLVALASGARLNDYAAKAQITVGTARTHLKRMLCKTGCHRQLDLVRMVTSDPLFRLVLETV